MAKIPREKAQLAMTSEDYVAQGNEPPQIVKLFPGRTLEEVLSASGGLSYLLDDHLRAAGESHVAAISGNGKEAQYLKEFLDEFLIPNFAYLREIGKLPEEYKDFYPEKEFPLPHK